MNQMRKPYRFVTSQFSAHRFCTPLSFFSILPDVPHSARF